jgi:hypothetical protein
VLKISVVDAIQDGDEGFSAFVGSDNLTGYLIGREGMGRDQEDNRLRLFYGLTRLYQVREPRNAVAFIVPGRVPRSLQTMGNLQGDGTVFLHMADEDIGHKTLPAP